MAAAFVSYLFLAEYGEQQYPEDMIAEIDYKKQIMRPWPCGSVMVHQRKDQGSVHDQVKNIKE
jgi:hypothetical protein